MQRDLNDLVRSPDGKVSEAKGFAVAFKMAMVYVFLQHTEEVLAEWTIFALFITAFLAPDLLKKLISMKAGVKETRNDVFTDELAMDTDRRPDRIYHPDSEAVARRGRRPDPVQGAGGGGRRASQEGQGPE